MPHRRFLLVYCTLVVAALACVARGEKIPYAQSKIVPPTAEWSAKVEKAAPAEATVEADKRKLLVFSLRTGYDHKVMPHVDRVFEILGEKTGAFSTTVTVDIEDLLPENLADYDVLVLNNNCSKGPRRNLFLDELESNPKYAGRSAKERQAKSDALEQSMLDFVAGGKGLVVVHGAPTLLNNSAKFNEMVGGAFDYHPPNQEVTIRTVDDAHPLVAAFRGKGPFIHRDEPYCFGGPYEKMDFRPLLSMDTEGLKDPKGRVGELKRYVAWIKPHGKGRVFYCSPSHFPESYESPTMLRFILDGVQYAAGDLKCDDSTPRDAEDSGTEVSSPNGSLKVCLELNDGAPHWSLSHGEEELLKPGRLGVEVDSAGLGAMESVGMEETTHRERVETVWGKFASYDNHYRQLCWTLRETDGEQRTLNLVFRVYDEGVGFRYEFPGDGGWGDEIRLTDGASEFRFADDGTAWAYHREHDPFGPQPLSKFHGGKGAELPMTVKCAADAYLAVLEAAIFRQAPFRLAPLEGDATSFRETFARSILPPGSKTSWRVVLAGDQPGDLLTSPVLFCLNPPCAIEDPGWIEPGLAFWDWRAWGATTKDGFKYELDMESWRRFIDFASEHNVRYLVLDANWYGPEFEPDSDPRTSRDHLVIQPDMTKPHIVRKPAPEDWKDPIDVPELIRYGKERGVGILLYFNDIARMNYPFEETLALYEQWGAAGIKYGFMKAKGQQKVLDTRKIVRLCAKHHLLCNFHDGPVPPSGDERTYPNYVTREFCHSQSDAMRAFRPSGFCEQVFVNMVAGPLDMCNGLFALENPARDRPRIFTNVESTVTAETARVLITYSGFSILPDCPEAYAEKADLFEFISRLPMSWDETRILHGSIGEFITTARRSGPEWFVGSATNEEGRTLPIVLDFLEEGRTYTATLYEDAPESHFKTNREAYQIRRMEVTRGSEIAAEMAPGGGHCIWLKPK